MPVLSHALWAIRIKAARRIHLAEDSAGAPLSVTLCGKVYDPNDRTKGTKSKLVDPSVCQACLTKTGYVDPEKKRLDNVVKLAKLAEMLTNHLEMPREDVREIVLEYLNRP
jgi:hypothetical protein